MATKINQAVTMAIAAVSCATVALFTPDWAQELRAAYTYNAGRPVLKGNAGLPATYNTQAVVSLPATQVPGFGVVRILVAPGANNTTIPPNGRITVEFDTTPNDATDCVSVNSNNVNSPTCRFIATVRYSLSTRVLYFPLPASLAGLSGVYRFTNTSDTATSDHTVTIEQATLSGLTAGIIRQP